jgi:hypothetical protein
MKYGISILAVAALMLAAPALGETWDGGADGLWNTATNWVGDTVPTGGSSTIGNGDTVTLSGTAGDVNFLTVSGGSTLNIEVDLALGDDLLFNTGGIVNMNDGFLDQGEKFKIAGGGSFFMNGGTAGVGNKLEIQSGGLLAFSGGNLEATDGDGVEFNGGTIRVDGIWTGAVGEDLIFFEAVTTGNGTYEFNPTAGGEIAPITSLGVTVSGSGKLNVNLDASTASDTLSLFEGGTVGAFVAGDNVTIMHGTTELDAGIAGSLALNEYALIYTDGTGLELEFHTVPEPATMSLLAIGGLALIRRRKRRA